MFKLKVHVAGLNQSLVLCGVVELANLKLAFNDIRYSSNIELF